MSSGSTYVTTPLAAGDREAAIIAAIADARTEARRRLAADVRLEELHTIAGDQLASTWLSAPPSAAPGENAP